MVSNQVVVYISADPSDFLAKSQMVKAELRRMEQMSMITTIAMNALKFSAIAGVGALIGMVAPAVLATKSLKDFDDNLNRITALGGPEFRKETANMIEEINRLTVYFGSAATDITEVIITFTKAGFEYAEVMRMLEPTLKLAIANQSDLAEASQLTMYAFALWGRKAGMDVYEMLDKMHRAANLSLMSIEDLAHAFQMAGSAASIGNVSYEEFLAIAGGLSMVAAEAGSQFGTLVTRMIVKGYELEEVLGVGGIWDEGGINVQRLIEVMRDGSIEMDRWRKAFDMWGVRSARPLMQMSESADEIERIYRELVEGTDTLDDAVELMRQSISALIGRFRQSIEVGFRQADVLDAIRNAFDNLITSMEGEDFARSLGSIVIISAQFIEKQGPQLIKLVFNLLESFMKLMPTIQSIANAFVGVLNIISKMPPGLIKLIALIMITNKILPITSILIPALTKHILILGEGSFLTGLRLSFTTTQIQNMALNAKALIAAVGGLVIGFMMVTSATNEWERGLGVLMITASSLIVILQTLIMLKGALGMGLTVPQMAMGAAAAAGVIGGITYALSSIKRPEFSDTLGTTALTIPGAVTQTTYNIKQNFYDVETTELNHNAMIGYGKEDL